ncbi:hypothetical protein CSB45_07390 [candidate division KSB3 bacterium]|uniref:Uncharacterized protein n=1 Tax=candidate division KSB3 bacterium TaxID=2044937 RepID=A0A2G6E6G3_9BACT|nr:MAG: hypothetical protein CSB45_07390 [candidate division KSB3 bacterium]PIE29859.1 MAG: hypothetical protein CSA57_06095 [candidate division KSB3 bacterium]
MTAALSPGRENASLKMIAGFLQYLVKENYCTAAEYLQDAYEERPETASQGGGRPSCHPEEPATKDLLQLRFFAALRMTNMVRMTSTGLE